MTKELKLLGKRFQQLREPYGTQEETALKSGFPLDFIQDLEEGNINPTYLDLIKLADTIGTYPSDFFDSEFDED